MRTTDQIAKMFYNPSPEPPENPVPEMSPGEVLAERLYDKSKPTEQTGNGLYDPTVGYSGFTDGLNTLTQHFDMTPEQAQQARRETVEFFTELSIPTYEAVGLHDLYVKHLTAPPSDEQVRAWTKETETRMKERFGDEAPERLHLAKEFIQSRPGLREALNLSGLGSHPDIVLKLMERAYAVTAARKT